MKLRLKSDESGMCMKIECESLERDEGGSEI